MTFPHWRDPEFPIELRLGEWQTVLSEVTSCDSLITDVPYSQRIIEGQRSAHSRRSDGTTFDYGGPRIEYEGWTKHDARDFVRYWFPCVKRWFVAFCSDDIARWFRDEFDAMGVRFAWDIPHLLPDDADARMAAAGWRIPWVKPDAAPGFLGVGPSPGAEWIVIARPEGSVNRRYRPGYYDSRQARDGDGFVGTKPLPLMRKIVADYSEVGDLVIDPFCGLGKTALACRTLGRACISSERDEEVFNEAAKRIRMLEPDLFDTPPTISKAKQEAMPFLDPRSTWRISERRRRRKKKKGEREELRKRSGPKGPLLFLAQ